MNERKLNPIAEVIVITIITFLINLFTGFIVGELMKGMYIRSATIIFLIGIIRMSLAIFAAAFICFDIIEKIKSNKGKLLVWAIIIAIVLSLVNNTVSILLMRYVGISAIVISLQITAVAIAVVSAVVIVLINHADGVNKAEGYNEKIKYDLLNHVLLLLFTFGIWQLVWVYRVTAYLNCIEDEEYRNPASKLLLFMFVPFYSWFWTYKSAQRIDKLAQRAEVVSDLAVVCLILEIFAPIVPPILMQDKINKIVDKNATR